jgi:hypothetical protein
MDGTDRVRHCEQCGKSVYNLSAMSRREAELLISQGGPLPCVRFYRRRDGSILTGDCPIGQQRIKRRRVLLTTAPVFMLGLYAWLLSLFEPASGTTLEQYLRRHEPYATALDWLSPRPLLGAPPPVTPFPPTAGQAVVVGKVAVSRPVLPGEPDASETGR